MSIHDDKVASLLVHLAAEFIAREAGRSTLITPTRAVIGRDHNATVFVTVFPEEQGVHAIEFLTRNADEFRSFLKKEARFSRLPRVHFEIDKGEEHRRHLDELSRDLENG